MAVALGIIGCLLFIGFAISRLRARKGAKEDMPKLFLRPLGMSAVQHRPTFLDHSYIERTTQRVEIRSVSKHSHCCAQATHSRQRCGRTKKSLQAIKRPD
jgi:hypothetical protein